jgi:LmbE family N-acetylglucosaminyl deacetylase
MTQPLSLLCILAHPDDESMGTGGILAKYAAEGVPTSLIVATRGERGWQGSPDENPGLEALGKLRELELAAAAQILGLSAVHYLDYVDGDLDQADPAEAIGKIVTHVRRIRPSVVVTFGPDGNYGHPDHIAVSQFTTAALVCAADTAYCDPADLPAYRVPKLYYFVDAEGMWEQILPFIEGEIGMTIDGVWRKMITWPEWQITTQIDATAYWRTVVTAVQCHRSQLSTLPPLDDLPEEVTAQIWGRPSLYRAYSLVNGGRQKEDDLFAGLR